MPGGELFHHLDIEGAFEEPTARFFAANVLLALDFLHNKVGEERKEGSRKRGMRKGTRPLGAVMGVT